MWEEYIRLLEKAGLTKGEVRVYAALLELGDSTVGSVVDKSGVTKSIIYQILERLIQKGLVSYIIKDKTKHYQASSPYRIVEFLEKQEKELSNTKESIEKAIPKLAETLNSQNLSQATIYEGFKGIMTVHDKRFEKLSKGEEYYFLGLPAEQPEYYHAYWQKDHAIRAKKGIKCKLLYNHAVKNEVLTNRNKFSLCDARRLSLSLDTPAWFLIYKEVTVIGLPLAEKPLAFEIVNKEVADSFRTYFDWFWRKTTPFKEK